MNTFLLLALCVVLSSATPISIVLKLNNNATAGVQSRETIYISNDNPYLVGANTISDVRVGVSLIGIVPPGSSLALSPEGAPVIGAITAGSYAPFYFDTKGDAGLWIIKVVVNYKDENRVDKSKEKYFPYLIKPAGATSVPKDVVESDESNADDFIMTRLDSASTKQARGTCGTGSTAEISSNSCNWNAAIDEKTFNTLGFVANNVNITSIVALNQTSGTCVTYKSDMSVGCSTPIPAGGGCGINFAVRCGACGQACSTIYIYYKTSNALGSPTKVWNSGCIYFTVSAGATGCRRDVADAERAIGN